MIKLPRLTGRALRRGALVCGLLSGGFLFSLRGFFFEGNVGTVEPGRLYRAAQPKGTLDELAARYALASVLNLRGGAPSDWWYADEVATAERLRIPFYDFPLEADERPSRRELLVLLDLLDRAPYPLLIHCKSGSDRTGLVAALYRLYVKGEAPERAEDEFALVHGHTPLFGPERLHEPLDEYAAHLRAASISHTPLRFRDWVERIYRDDPAETDGDKPVEPLEAGPRALRLARQRAAAASGS